MTTEKKDKLVGLYKVQRYFVQTLTDPSSNQVHLLNPVCDSRIARDMSGEFLSPDEGPQCCRRCTQHYSAQDHQRARRSSTLRRVFITLTTNGEETLTHAASQDHDSLHGRTPQALFQDLLGLFEIRDFEERIEFAVLT